jgi:hypothetical protein
VEGEGVLLKRIGLVAASALVSINIWTGAPLLAIWIGSKVQGSLTTLSMSAVLAVIGVLAVTVFVLAFLLAQINRSYDDLVGRAPAGRQTSPWLRSMRGEREADIREKFGMSPIEKVMVATVVAAALAFEVWFFFFAGSSLPNA